MELLSNDSGPRRTRRFLVGATACGKSAVAHAIAMTTAQTAHPVRLISMDSMLVYRGLDIVTAKPSRAELLDAPLAAIDLVEPSREFSVARYLDAAEAAEAEIAAAGGVALFVGGTGLYLKALTHGLFEGPAADPELRTQLSKRAGAEGPQALHADLARIDPDAAAKIHARDAKRIIRALEVFAATGERISQLQRQWTLSLGFPRIIVGLRVARDELHRRIEERIDQMLQSGVINEIERVAGGGLSREAAAAVGVREALDHLGGKLTLEACRSMMVKRTRELARRQATWLRAFKEICWIEAGGGRPVDATAADAARALELAPARARGGR